MEMILSCEMADHIQTTWCCIPEDDTFRPNCVKILSVVFRDRMWIKRCSQFDTEKMNNVEVESKGL
jgi:hypothetical protein